MRNKRALKRNAIYLKTLRHALNRAISYKLRGVQVYTPADCEMFNILHLIKRIELVKKNMRRLMDER